ncbi:ECM1 protein, partial [Daphoenositta chrysoptera]|nr:ECM1 protein [Daphoenositta chrysoptera]
RQFHCCRRLGAARRRCFAQGTPAPAWDPVPSWQDTDVAWDLVTEPPFPPGEPTAANLGNICGLRALRPG